MEQRSSSSGWAQGGHGGDVPSLSWIPVREQGRAFQGGRGWSGSSTGQRGVGSNHRPQGVAPGEIHRMYTHAEWGQDRAGGQQGGGNCREEGLVSLKVISSPLPASQGSKLEPYECALN